MTLLDGMTPAFLASGRVQYMSIFPDGERQRRTRRAGGYPAQRLSLPGQRGTALAVRYEHGGECLARKNHLRIGLDSSVSGEGGATGKDQVPKGAKGPNGRRRAGYD